MDAILDELKSMTFLYYNEKKLLERGDVAGCLEAAIGRMRRRIVNTNRGLLVFVALLVAAAVLSAFTDADGVPPSELMPVVFWTYLSFACVAIRWYLMKTRLEAMALAYRIVEAERKARTADGVSAIQSPATRAG